MENIEGKTISITSNADVRYVGIIDEIDGERGTISIKQVRIFGTEERNPDPMTWVLPNPEIHDRLVLSGDSVKGLNILEVPAEEVKPTILPEMFTFAMMKGINLSQFGAVQPVKQVYQINQQSQQQQGQVNSTEPSNFTAEATPTTKSKPTTTTTTQTSQPAPVSAPVSALVSTPTPEATPDLQKAFDFEENNAKFDMEDVIKDKPKIESVYNKKSSFFDDLSPSLNKAKPTDKAQWNNLNKDTFGETGETQWNNYGNRGRGGYRGRGGNRGGNRGRGGNYNNYGNNNRNRPNFNTNRNNGNYKRNNEKEKEKEKEPEWLF